MPSGNQVENDRIMQRKTENANLVCIAHLYIGNRIRIPTLKSEIREDLIENDQIMM